MDSSLRARNTRSEDGKPERNNETQVPVQPSSGNDLSDHIQALTNPSSLKWIIVVFLVLTTTIGTYRSFSIYSKDNPERPIHQLTRIPVSSLRSTHSVDQKLTTNTLPYFANKSNFFNQKFVKLGWAWTSFAIWFHSIAIASCYFGAPNDQQDRSKPSQKSEESRESFNHQSNFHQDSSHPSHHVPRILSLHFIATILWIFLTQWFFGSSLIERVLIISGAKCVPSLKSQTQLGLVPEGSKNEVENIYCQTRWGKRLDGLDAFTLSTHRPYWSGGIDVSGHTFLLSFSILIIISALQPSLNHLILKKTETMIPTSYRMAICVNLGILILWWWMLLMTSLYFHGPIEKFSGLFLGTGSWFLVELIVNKLLG